MEAALVSFAGTPGSAVSRSRRGGPSSRALACAAGLGGGWCPRPGELPLALTESRHSKRYPPLRPGAEREARRAPFVVGDGSFTPSRGSYAVWGISKWRDAGRVLTDDSGRFPCPNTAVQRDGCCHRKTS